MVPQPAAMPRITSDQRRDGRQNTSSTINTITMSASTMALLPTHAPDFPNPLEVTMPANPPTALDALSVLIPVYNEERTVAEILGREVRDITVRIGESQMGASTGSGGSTTCPATASTS